jgi:hypothetical protein
VRSEAPAEPGAGNDDNDDDDDDDDDVVLMLDTQDLPGIIWWNCAFPEEANRGYQNTEESQRACALAAFYVVQGVAPENITILTGYRSKCTISSCAQPT